MKLFVFATSFLFIISCARGDNNFDSSSRENVVESIRAENLLLEEKIRNLELIVSESLATRKIVDADLLSELESVLLQINDTQSQVAVLLEAYKRTEELAVTVNDQLVETHDQRMSMDRQQSLISDQLTSINRIEESLKEIRASLELQENNNSTLAAQVQAQREISSELEKEIAAQKNEDKKLSEQIASLPQNSCRIEDAATSVRDITYKVEINGVFSSSSGSAFYIGNSEFITNEHVVERNSYVLLKQNQTQYTASVIAADPRSDLALLRISDDSEVGEAISFRQVDDKDSGLKVGVTSFPRGLGLDPSITYGAISRVFVDDSFEKIQTDAAVSPGSSGGPLFDSCGKLVGVITSKLSSTSTEGIGFAISSDELADFLSYWKSIGLR